jgi:hypothetical protein
MKITSWTLQAKNLRPKIFQFLFATPLLSARIYFGKRSRKEPFTLILLKFLLSLVFLICVIFIAKNFLQPLNYTKMIVISPMIYLFTEVIGGMGQILFYLSPMGIAQIHKNPLRSKSIGEFWGRRWNFWVRDWLVDISHSHRKILIKKLSISFLVSGLFHELLVNLPYFLYYHESFFGNMTLYFTIQALGLWIEKKWLHSVPPLFRRVFLWVVVILPAPIFINRPLLIFFGIING